MNEEISRQMNRGWTTRDIMVTALLSLVMGIIYVPLSYFTMGMMVFPYIHPFIMGIYFCPIFLVAYLIRKPGTALLASIVAFTVAVPFTPYGAMMLIEIVLIGLPIEIVLMAGRYNKFQLGYLMITGAVCGLIVGLMEYISLGFANLSPLLQIILFISAILGGVILGGLLAKLIGDAVFKTGIISKDSDKSQKPFELEI